MFDVLHALKYCCGVLHATVEDDGHAVVGDDGHTDMIVLLILVQLLLIFVMPQSFL